MADKKEMPPAAGKQNRGQREKLTINNSIISENFNKKYNLLCKEVYDLFFKPGEVVEIRILNVYGTSALWNCKPAQGVVSGYFDNYQDFFTIVCMAISNHYYNINFTIQVIDPRLIGRACNKLIPAKATTSDRDVLYYRWIPIDIDPVRPSGISSSDSELQKAIDLRNIICEWIFDTTIYGRPLTAISGNGAHILIRLPEDLPVPENNTKYIKNFLSLVHSQFSTNDVVIDTTVYNPARIWKLYGTKAVKGNEVEGNEYREAQVHRESFIDSLGDYYAL